MKLNCDGANKMLKSYMDDLKALKRNEANDSVYTYTASDKPDRADYSLNETEGKIAALVDKICKLKHAINHFNVTTVIPSLGYTVDEALVRMQNLNARKEELNKMRSMPKRTRNMGFRASEPEYIEPNFNLEEAEAHYRAVADELIHIQQGLNLINLTVEFEVDI